MYAMHSENDISIEQLVTWGESNTYTLDPIAITANNFGNKNSNINFKPITISVTKPVGTFVIKRKQVPNSNRSVPTWGGKVWIPVLLKLVNDPGGNGKGIIDDQISSQMDQDSENSVFSMVYFTGSLDDDSGVVGSVINLHRCKIIKVIELDEEIHVYIKYEDAIIDLPKDENNDYDKTEESS